jgi:hypothetical protein
MRFDQCERLDRLIAAFLRRVPMRHPPQFVVNQRHQLIERLPIAATPLTEELGHVSWKRVGHLSLVVMARVVPLHNPGNGTGVFAHTRCAAKKFKFDDGFLAGSSFPLVKATSPRTKKL